MSPVDSRPSVLPRHDDLRNPLEPSEEPAVHEPADWRDRREQIKSCFARYVYGSVPEAPEVTVDVRNRGSIGDGSIILRECTVRYSNRPEAPPIELAIFGPLEEPAPTIVGLNFRGNHSLVDDTTVSQTDREQTHGNDERGGAADSWCVEHLVERGYALATFHQADVAPDADARATQGVISHFDPPGPSISAWGTLAAWAWGLQRIVDVLSEVSFASDCIVYGHSRRGKAALLAGATDERIDMVVPHQSGTGGMAPARGNNQETISDIVMTFPHWFNDVFPAFAGRPERLPVDQHHLASLVAPRPLLDLEGTRDYWANPGLALDVLRGADPVYNLLNRRGIVDDGVLFEEPIRAESCGRLLQYRRETGHTMNRAYWDVICDFADFHLE